MRYHINIKCKDIPTNELPDRINEVPKDKSIAVFCPANVRSAVFYTYLLSKGFLDVRILVGGYFALTEALIPGKVIKIKGSDFPEGPRFVLDFTVPNDNIKKFKNEDSLIGCAGTMVRSAPYGIAITFDKECQIENLKVLLAH
jgi:predicted sulfurtransferase